METSDVFRRVELKYLLDSEQKEELLQRMKEYMVEDVFPHSSIYNIYYDTDRYLLIRNSLDHPVYKEKVRIRSYSPIQKDGTVFAEIKKKYENIVYKRRIETSWQAVKEAIQNRKEFSDTQIGREFTKTVQFYKTLQPAMFIGYQRDAFTGIEDPSFRITFDTQLVYRTDLLQFCRSEKDMAILPDNLVLMEVKSTGGMPLWMTHFLDQNNIYKTSFSKYGSAYRNEFKHGGITV